MCNTHSLSLSSTANHHIVAIRARRSGLCTPLAYRSGRVIAELDLTEKIAVFYIPKMSLLDVFFRFQIQPLAVGLSFCCSLRKFWSKTVPKASRKSNVYVFRCRLLDEWAPLLNGVMCGSFNFLIQWCRLPVWLLRKKISLNKIQISDWRRRETMR